MSPQSLEAHQSERRKFEPSPAFSEQALVGSIEEYQKRYDESLQDPESFWAEVAEELTWFRKWDSVLDSREAPHFKWFVGGKTNICANAVDRHALGAAKNKAAIIWEGEDGEQRTYTFAQLKHEVSRFANVLRRQGVQKGDRVTLYLPMIPELAIAVLACARIGAAHSVIFAGFSADSIADRIQDCYSKLVITADGGYRRGKVMDLKGTVDQAVASCACVERVLVVRRRPFGEPLPCKMERGRDFWYDEEVTLVGNDCAPEPMDAEDMLFLLYTSGTTGKPKGIMHTTGGYMVYTYMTARYIFDLKPDDIYFCTADIGWITGHSYMVYGPLLNAATVVMYEGAPNYPDEARFWEIVEKLGVTIFYTAPTAIRSFMKWGDKWHLRHDLSSLRLLGTVGEPINPEAWMWYHEKIGYGRCPIVDTWWQTETGGIMIAPQPGAIPTRPGSATLPFYGVDAAILDEEGNDAQSGYLAIRKPWPGMLRGIYGDSERFRDTYWSRWGGKYYFPGDGAYRDEDGYIWVVGRVDDVVNVSGHRIGTAELESVYVEHPSVAEAGVIGVAHEVKGQGLVSFVTLRQGQEETPELIGELDALIAARIGKFARPEKTYLTRDLPKTRSGKIMRRILRNLAEGKEIGNVTTLADPSVVEEIRLKVSGDNAQYEI